MMWSPVTYCLAMTNIQTSILAVEVSYKKYSGIDVTSVPSKVEDDAHFATDSSGWYWWTRDINALADVNNPARVTKKINPVMKDIDRRRVAARRAFMAINQGVEPCNKNWNAKLNISHGW